jgi:hypothetical protein
VVSLLCRRFGERVYSPDPRIETACDAGKQPFIKEGGTLLRHPSGMHRATFCFSKGMFKIIENPTVN